MDKINPFTNAPSNPPGQPAAPAVPQNQPPKSKEPKQKKEFDIKPLLKMIFMIIIGVVVAKLAFDSLVPGPKPQPQPGVKDTKPAYKPSSQQTAAPAKGKAAKSKQAEPLSLSEQFAAAKKAVKPEQPRSDEQFVINGIFLSEADGMSSAIVNNKVVQVGDTIDGFRVDSITIEGLELSKIDQVIKLRNK
jgi:hypothetical protein